ncbi:MAG: MFS transporter [Candidatus Amulumruptor caecigallinarius]|nr:MFS transporter [Candidatus Amulumruptor caecigallinarius]
MKTKPDLGFWKLWNLSFGFFGVQIAYALQSANVSRIFTTIGADPHDLSYFWILPPLMGLIVQPIVGMMSDRTWTRFGRRLPYLIVGALFAVIVMCLLPNSGSFNFTVQGAILFGLVALMVLDTSINMAMQPFKMLVGDMVNEKQKARAYSIQSFLCNAGSVMGYIFPILFMWLGIKNVAPEGVVPPTVVWSFYIGAAILLICVIYSLIKIKEWPPKEYNEYNGVVENKEGKKEKANVFALLKNAPSTFWTVGVVQFFCWFAFLFLWTYVTNTVAHKAFNTPEVVNYPGITYEGKNYQGKFLLADDNTIIIDHGKKVTDYLETADKPFKLTTADIVEKRADGTLDMSGVDSVQIDNPEKCAYMTRTVLNAASDEYNEAGNWVGLLYAVQAMASVLWALVLPRLGGRKFSYMLSLILGAVGFVMTGLLTNQYLLFVSFALIGCAWAAMLAWPFTILTNSLHSGNIGAYLGLFNCTICIPQIVAALMGGWILSMLSMPGEIAPEWMMMIGAGISLVIGAVCVLFINEGGGKAKPVETPAISDEI